MTSELALAAAASEAWLPVEATVPPAARSAIPLWIVAAHADLCSAEERDVFARRVEPDESRDRLLLVTCHRAELYGVGAAPSTAALRALATAPSPARRLELRLLTGEAAVRHALRLAAGLESAVIGEDQVLHQVRELREAARSRQIEPHLSRLLELSIGVGRRSRAARAQVVRSDVGLAQRAVDWLCLRAGLRRGDPLLVVGAGRMGGLVAREARRRGLRLTVASRTLERAAEVATRVGGRAVDLAEASRLVPQVAGIAVALAGPWAEANGAVALPPTVDLSSPPALPSPPAASTEAAASAAEAPRSAAEARAEAGLRLDIDGLYRWHDAPRSVGDEAAYQAAAGALVKEALASYRRWSAGRASLTTLRELRGRAETRRAEEVERLLRRLPDLAPRERELVEAFSERLAAALLHTPTARLREDVDGSAAAAAQRLFDL